MQNKDFNGLIAEFSKLEEVEAILLAGSRVMGTEDKNSDYDVYIYINQEIEIKKREIINSKYCSMMEINNQYWETEDDGILKEGNVPIELIYRSFDFIKGILSDVIDNNNAWVGYSTCFWSNFVNSKILFDRNGLAKELMSKYDIAYPQELKLNIIRKNYDLLKSKTPAYYFQIEKAIKRDDIVSVNHRVSALFESYFDIIFAINEIKHPGEKKILKFLNENANKLPVDMEKNVREIISEIPNCNNKILKKIDILINNLNCLIKKEGIKL